MGCRDRRLTDVPVAVSKHNDGAEIASCLEDLLQGIIDVRAGHGAESRVGVFRRGTEGGKGDTVFTFCLEGFPEFRSEKVVDEIFAGNDFFLTFHGLGNTGIGRAHREGFVGHDDDFRLQVGFLNGAPFGSEEHNGNEENTDEANGFQDSGSPGSGRASDCGDAKTCGCDQDDPDEDQDEDIRLEVKRS